MEQKSIKLEPESRSFVDYVNQLGGVDLTKSVEYLRETSEKSAQRLAGDYVFTGVKIEQNIPASENGVAYTIPVTILKPRLDKEHWQNVMVYFHGGGWVWSSRATHMKLCEMIADQCKCIVVNVEYRLSPEHKFPACYNDAEAVTKWCLDNRLDLAGNESTIVGVGGDSAGANISASVCHLVAGLSYQVLIYPSLTMDKAAYPSYNKYGNDLLLTKPMMEWFGAHFLSSPSDAANELCSPMNRRSFTGLPPALFIVSECDPLADQSPEYQGKLEKAGVKTDYVLLKETVHGFVSKPGHFKTATEKTVHSIAQFLSKY